MSNINKHLKELRTKKGFTQDAVADKIGLTRQAISGYESGKRQPGIDILMQLAALYEVDIESILYGKKDVQKQKRAAMHLAITVTTIFLCLQMLTGLLLTLSHTLYPVETGIITADKAAIVQKHVELCESAQTVERAAIVLLSMGALLVLGLDLSAKHTFSWKQKGIFFLLALGASWLIAIFWSIVHPIYTLMEFVMRGPVYFAGVAVLLTIDLVIWKIRQK